MSFAKFKDQPLIKNVSRRDMLKGIVSGGGFVVAAQFLPSIAMADGGHVNQYKTGADGMPGGVVWNPQVYVSIAPDGTVTIVSHRSEMGTGSRTSLPMVVADEMEADWSKVKIVQAEGDEAKYGNQDTDGSRSVRHFIQPMRWCGAATRNMLEGADVSQRPWFQNALKGRSMGDVHEALLLARLTLGHTQRLEEKAYV